MMKKINYSLFGYSYGVTNGVITALSDKKCKHYVGELSEITGELKTISQIYLLIAGLHGEEYRRNGVSFKPGDVTDYFDEDFKKQLIGLFTSDIHAMLYMKGSREPKTVKISLIQNPTGIGFETYYHALNVEYIMHLRAIQNFLPDDRAIDEIVNIVNKFSAGGTSTVLLHSILSGMVHTYAYILEKEEIAKMIVANKGHLQIVAYKEDAE